MADEYYDYPRSHANPKLLYNGDMPVPLEHNVQSMEYTDYAEGNSDELIIYLTDQKQDWLSGWFPEKGQYIDAYIDYYNWNQVFTVYAFHCGKFVIDDISLGGRAHQMTVKGVSQPAGTDFKETPRYKTWQKITIKQIAEEFVKAYGLESLVFSGDETVIEELEQDGISDCQFLKEVCDRYGYALKIYMVGFVIYRKAEYEAKAAIKIFKNEDEWDDWSYNTTLAGTYTGAKISYSNPNKGSEDDDIEITVGTAERLLIINERADSEAEAMEIAKNRVNKENESAETLEFTMRFQPAFIASSCFEVQGIHEKVNGKYFIEEIRTRMSKQGLKMNVSAYKIFKRL